MVEILLIFTKGTYPNLACHRNSVILIVKGIDRKRNKIKTEQEEKSKAEQVSNTFETILQ